MLTSTIDSIMVCFAVAASKLWYKIVIVDKGEADKICSEKFHGKRNILRQTVKITASYESFIWMCAG
jgi:hypothetical protein